MPVAAAVIRALLCHQITSGEAKAVLDSCKFMARMLTTKEEEGEGIMTDAQAAQLAAALEISVEEAKAMTEADLLDELGKMREDLLKGPPGY